MPGGLTRRALLLGAAALATAKDAGATLAAASRYLFSRSWGSTGTAAGRLDGPRGVAV
jgi:hypothetical protein